MMRKKVKKLLWRYLDGELDSKHKQFIDTMLITNVKVAQEFNAMLELKNRLSEYYTAKKFVPRPFILPKILNTIKGLQKTRLILRRAIGLALASLIIGIISGTMIFKSLQNKYYSKIIWEELWVYPEQM